MQQTFNTPNEVIKAAFSQPSGFLPDNLPPSVKDQANRIGGYDDLVYALRDDAKMPQDIAETVASSTMFAALERFGIKPEEWKFTVDPSEMRTKVYGAEQWENARRFSATWTDVAQISLLAASVFGLVTMVAGAGIAAGTLATAGAAIRAGQGWSAVSEIVKLGALKGIKWLSIPAGFTWIAERVASFSNTQLSTTGDLEGYLLQGSAKAEQLKAGGGSGYGSSGGGYAQVSKTRTTTYKTAKPKLFLGILYAGQVGKYEQFVRQVDDSITSEEDLRNDVQINLTKYISTIDNNLSYAIQIKNSPADELGVPRTGTWATLSIYFTNQFHKRLFLDEILLGPIDPFVYYPETQVVTSLQHEIPKIVDFDGVTPVDKMPEKLRIVDTAGNVVADVVPGSGPATPPVAPVGNPAKFIGNSGKEYTGVQDAQGNFIPWPTPNIGSPEDIEIKSKSGRILQTPGGVATSTPSSTSIPSPYVVQPVTNSTPEPAGAFTGTPPAQPEHVRLDFPREVTVAVDVLNVRSAPNTTAPLAGSQKLYRGDRFTIVESVNGEVVSGTNNGRWWKSSLGNYVWSGGTIG